jgi:hypothetical protein
LHCIFTPVEKESRHCRIARPNQRVRKAHHGHFSGKDCTVTILPESPQKNGMVSFITPMRKNCRTSAKRRFIVSPAWRPAISDGLYPQAMHDHCSSCGYLLTRAVRTIGLCKARLIGRGKTSRAKMTGYNRSKLHQLLLELLACCC